MKYIFNCIYYKMDQTVFISKQLKIIYKFKIMIYKLKSFIFKKAIKIVLRNSVLCLN